MSKPFFTLNYCWETCFATWWVTSVSSVSVFSILEAMKSSDRYLFCAFAGQPRRHLLTTGWSVFVSAKRLQAGDSVLFIR
jgi:hypothetical protein